MALRDTGQPIYYNIIKTNVDSQRFCNLNLNAKFSKKSNVAPFHSKIKLTEKIKQDTKTNHYHEETRKASSEMKLNGTGSARLCYYAKVKEEVKQVSFGSNRSSSTLSLHIAAYQNSVEASTNAVVNEEKLILSFVKQPFVCERQQNEESLPPECMSFRASEKMLKCDRDKVDRIPKKFLKIYANGLEDYSAQIMFNLLTAKYPDWLYGPPITPSPCLPVYDVWMVRQFDSEHNKVSSHMDLKAIIANAVLSAQETQIRPEKPRIRFRGQRVINTNKHDARGEAVEHIANMLKQHGVPIWGALPIAYQFADHLPKDMSTTNIPFDPNVYEEMEHTKFYQRLNEEMLQYLHGVATGSDPMPEKPENWDRYLYAVYENRNHKKEMEDKKIILPLMCVVEPSKDHALKDASLFGVFDGHGGDECATYAAVHLPHCLIDSTTENSSKLLTESLKDLDKQISVRAEHDRIGGGSTSVVALIRDGVIDIAWIGDSAIGALTNDSVITLTKPHNLSDPKEVERVIAAGGMILNVFGEDRVNGVLNITRALGDSQARPMISSEPSDSRFDIKESGYYMMFLASDGVWDVLSEEEIYENVVEFIKKNPQSEYEKLALFIGNAARAISTDNLMLIIVFLKPLSEIWQHFSP